MVYFKVTNEKECHYDHQYVDGINYLNKPFSVDGNDWEASGFHFTTIDNIHKFMDYGCNIREIELPNDEPNFQMSIDYGFVYRSNCVVLGKKHKVEDLPKLYFEHNHTKFDNELIYLVLSYAIKKKHDEMLKWILNIKDTKIKYIDVIFKILKKNNFDYNIIDRFKEYTDDPSMLFLYHMNKNNFEEVEKIVSNYKITCGTQIMAIASKKGCVDTLNFITKLKEKYGLKFICSAEALNGVSENNQIEVLNWWKNSGLQLRYDCSAINKAIKKGSIEAVMWWINSGLKIKYNHKTLTNFFGYSDPKMLQLWIEISKERNMPILFSQTALIRASENNKFDNLAWWKKSTLLLSYDSDVIGYAVRNNHIDIVKWWIDSGLKINITKSMINFAAKHNNEIYQCLLPYYK